MPKGTTVHRQYEGMRAKGYSKAKAAKIAQANTGKSLRTGKASKKGGKR